MSWDEPDREFGPRSKVPKPYCATRPAVGDAQDWAEVALYLVGRGLDPALALRNGWYASRAATDTELRVVIPCTSANLTNKYWQARLARETKEKLPPRYQSPVGVTRGDALAVVLPRDAGWRGTVLVEGPMDALAAAEVGYMGIGWMGTDPGQLPIDFARTLLVKGQPRYVVSDRDAISAAVRIWSQFVGAFLINPTPYKDLAAMPFEEREDFFR